MTLVIITTVLILLVATVRAAFHDGSGPAAPPRSHHEDLRFPAPLSR